MRLVKSMVSCLRLVSNQLVPICGWYREGCSDNTERESSTARASRSTWGSETVRFTSRPRQIKRVCHCDQEEAAGGEQSADGHHITTSISLRLASVRSVGWPGPRGPCMLGELEQRSSKGTRHSSTYLQNLSIALALSKYDNIVRSSLLVGDTYAERAAALY